MSTLVNSLIGFTSGTLTLLGAYFLFKKRVAQGGSARTSELNELLLKSEQEATSNLPLPSDFVASSLIAEIARQTQAIIDLLNQERVSLEKAEELLDKARKEVEKKEADQQALKLAREEDEKELALILGRFDQIQGECSSLEENLANSLSRLDQILNDMELTDEQQALLQQLSQSLDQSASLLSELSTEHRTINQRLSLLKGQVLALEEEYTRLVEQQLAG
jgi:chromosome segregation ATPase